MFESSDSQADLRLKPLRVPRLKDGIFSEAVDLLEALPGWSVVSKDEAKGLIECTRKARLLGGEARVTISFEAPEGVPSTTVKMRSESKGGLLNHDKQNVLEFMEKLRQRVV
jgi:hypothetical protein